MRTPSHQSSKRGKNRTNKGKYYTILILWYRMCVIILHMSGRVFEQCKILNIDLAILVQSYTKLSMSFASTLMKPIKHQCNLDLDVCKRASVKIWLWPPSCWSRWSLDIQLLHTDTLVSVFNSYLQQNLWLHKLYQIILFQDYPFSPSK